MTTGKNRKNITDALGRLLIRQKFGDMGTYYASEVSFDAHTTDVRRVDFLEFRPASVMSVSGIEKGIFVCYEVKSCPEDFHSGHGLNFEGEKNYIVTTAETFVKIRTELPYAVGCLVPVRNYVRRFDDIFDMQGQILPEADDFDGSSIDGWKLVTAVPSRAVQRTRSMTELLFCMLRSKH